MLSVLLTLVSVVPTHRLSLHRPVCAADAKVPRSVGVCDRKAQFACAAGVLVPPWAERQGTVNQLLPNLSCNTSDLLNSVQPLESHADVQRLPRLELTIAYLYYCSQQALSVHATGWSAWPEYERTRLFFLIIDDGSPNNMNATTALPPDVRSQLRIAIVRIEQDLLWNVGGARNLIFATAPTELVLLMDLDLVVPLPLAMQLLQLVRLMDRLEKEHGPKILYEFPRYSLQRNMSNWVHPAVMLLRKETYWLAGGCDEDFVGAYGNTDPHFKWRAARTGTTAPLLRSIRTIPMRLQPMQQNKTSDQYGCPISSRNTTRNAHLFIAKRKGRIAWSSEYLRFTWHVAHVANIN